MSVPGGVFQPAWWLRSPHLQTLWPFLFRRPRRLPHRTERLELEDGDFLDLAWCGAENAPLILMLHGLQGSIHSHYARGLIPRLNQAGYQVCLMHFRGCSGEPNRLDRGYHSGETGDLARVVDHLLQRSGAIHAAIGFSLGGNVLLKWLGEQGGQAGVGRAIAVSVPFRLADAAQRMDRGFSRLYQRHLVHSLRRDYRRKFASRPAPLAVDVDQLDSFWSFDDQVTAPLHGFRDVHDYYQQASCRPYLGAIRTETLIIHACDDPFMFCGTVPDETELSASTRLLLNDHGGHVGFVGGPWPWQPRYWLDDCISDWLGPACDVRSTPDHGMAGPTNPGPESAESVS